MVTEPAVSVRSLSLAFGETRALDDVSFAIDHGELFGFIGPDGGGKTTLFRILTTLLLPDSGRATVLGLDAVRDFWAIRARVGYMPGRFSLYPDLSVAEIGRRLGFGEPTNFGRFFHREAGLSPGAFRAVAHVRTDTVLSTLYVGPGSLWGLAPSGPQELPGRPVDSGH